MQLVVPVRIQQQSKFGSSSGRSGGLKLASPAEHAVVATRIQQQSAELPAPADAAEVEQLVVAMMIQQQSPAAPEPPPPPGLNSAWLRYSPLMGPFRNPSS